MGMAGCGHLVSLATRMADLLAVAPAAAIPQNEGGLKSAQTCLAVFADFGTELRSGESFDRLLD